MSMRNGLTGTPSLLPLHLDRRIPCWIGLDASRRAPVPAPVCCCWNLWPLLTRVLIFLERPRNETLNLGVLKCQNVNSHQLSSHQLNSHQPISHQLNSHQPISDELNSHQLNSHQPISHQLNSCQLNSHKLISHTSSPHTNSTQTKSLNSHQSPHSIILSLLSLPLRSSYKLNVVSSHYCTLLSSSLCCTRLNFICGHLTVLCASCCGQ